MSESLKNNRELYEKTNPVFNTAKMTLFQLAQQGNTHAAKISEKLGLTEDTQKSQSFSMGPEEEMTFQNIVHHISDLTCHLSFRRSEVLFCR